MRTIPSALAGFTALWIASTSVQAEPLPEKIMRDLRVHIHFMPKSGYWSPSGGGKDPALLRSEFTQGTRMAFSMWESMFPAMHVALVDDIQDANLEVRVGNFKGIPESGRDLAGPVGNCARPSLGDWEGCSFFPNEWNTDGLNVIYIETHGTPKYRFHAFDFISRDRLYKGYHPASNPPKKGWIRGWYDLWDEDDDLGCDVSRLVFHEFGHSMGIGHLTLNRAKMDQFYGLPHAPNTAPPGSTPNLIQVTPTQVPGLPPEYYYDPSKKQYGYYGGGTPTSPWVGDLKIGVIPQCAMIAFSTVENEVPHPGSPGANHELFNSRIVHKDAADFFKSQVTEYNYLMQWPNSLGLTLLQKANGTTQLTSNWTKATSLAQLNGTPQSDPYFVKGVHNNGQIRRFAAGGAHGLAVRKNGTLYAWGGNDRGQLGDGTTTPKSTPKKIGTATNWVSVAAGADFSLGLREDGSLWAWGSRAYGQVGDNSTTGNQTTPKQVSGTWAMISAGQYHALGMKVDGTLWAWGFNSNGQLGYTTPSGYSASPKQITSVVMPWVAINAGHYHSQALDMNGQLFSWGYNYVGGAGVGHFNPVNQPTQEYTYRSDWRRFVGGYAHSAAIDGRGYLHTWGYNGNGQLGLPSGDEGETHTPALYVGESFVTASAGHDFTNGITPEGRLFSWGGNDYGQLGIGGAPGGSSHWPLEMSGQLTDWTQVASGPDFALAMKEDGMLWGWGSNAFGQLGNAATADAQTVPVRAKWNYYGPTEVKVMVPKFNYVEPATVSLTGQAKGTLTKLEFYRKSGGTTTLMATKTAPPYAYDVTNLGYGVHNVWVVAYDDMGSSTKSSEATVYVSTLTITTTWVPNPKTYSLPTEGSKDWVHWGYSSSQMENHKVTTPALFDPLDKMQWDQGSKPVSVPGATMGFTWSGGAPVSSVTTANRNGMMAYTTPNNRSWGPRFTIHGVGTTTRTAKIFADITNVDVDLSINMGMNNASTGKLTQNGARVYTITARTPDPGITDLFVALTGYATGSGNIALQAATVK